MSWIDKELKRRAAQTAPPTATGTLAPEDDGARMRELWSKVVAANDALPEPLRLRVDAKGPPGSVADAPVFESWMHAPNGAALGFAGDGIRYVWPEVGVSRSNNLWIRWHGEQQCYVVLQRMGTGAMPRMASSRLDERRIGRLIRRLVVGEPVRRRDIRRRVWGLF